MILQFPVHPPLISFDLTSPSGVAPAGGSDILMDLLSIGTSPAQTTGPTPNAAINLDNIGSVSPLDRLSAVPSSASSLASQLSNPDSVRGIIEKQKSPQSAPPVMDLLDGLSSPPSVRGEYAENPVFPSITAFENGALKVMFSFTKPPGKPQVTVIQSTFTNMSTNGYTDFIFQAAVPKFVQLHLDPASSNILPPSGTGSVTQTLTVTNSLHGQKAIAMRIRIAYKANNQDKLEQGQISNFPPGL